jgi:hypothetical protein
MLPTRTLSLVAMLPRTTPSSSIFEAVEDLRIGLVRSVGTVHLRRSGLVAAGSAASAGSAGCGRRLQTIREQLCRTAGNEQHVRERRSGAAATRGTSDRCARRLKLKTGHARCFARGVVVVVRLPGTRLDLFPSSGKTRHL